MKKPKIIGIILIVITGLLNFHIPHFLIEPNDLSSASRILEIVYLINLLGAFGAAFGIYRDKRWGWLLGIGVSILSASLWLAQETIGLPGLPQQWFEPSRIVSLVIEVIFVIVAVRQLRIKMSSNTEL